ncbi:MAG: bifunctional phosphoribosylaminoimidazolecarboxamide formyltransferase/IMP cyclohydrolase [Candidatus Porifericomitaceae bacterium WSBS_2022_MAG_OTU9]
MADGVVAVRVERALVSVSDKAGIPSFCAELAQMGVEIIATGGTAKLLQENNIAVTSIDAITGFPEIMDGRVKTLHPKIYAGLLARPGKDEGVLAEHGINPIQLVVVNLYPFVDVVRYDGCTMDDAVEQIDIGGPCMIRAAAKNHAAVGVVVDPGDYEQILEQLRSSDCCLSGRLRLELAKRAFAHTAAYDGNISNYFNSLGDQGNKDFPQSLTLQFAKQKTLRYGENPHQKAALYVAPDGAPAGTLAQAELLQGKPASFNNYLDADVACACVACFSEPAITIVKHGNPCGVASCGSLPESWQAALACDREAAFGGVVACNRRIDEQLARLVADMFIEVLIAPGVAPEALPLLAQKKNMRVFATAPLRPFGGEWALDMRRISGGLLLQDGDTGSKGDGHCKVQGSQQPSDQMRRDLMFAWQVARHVKSNAIVLARDQRTIGIGAGQMNRADSVRVALQKAERAGFEVKGAVMASDAFFPFSDGVEIAGKAGVCAVIHPGGSVRDEEVTAAAAKLGMCMLHTGVRHFRH